MMHCKKSELDKWFMWNLSLNHFSVCRYIDSAIISSFTSFFFFYTIMTEKFHVRIFCLQCQKTESLWGRITHLKTSLQALINSNYWPLTYDTSLDIRSSRTFLCIKHFYFKYMSTFSWLYFDFQGHRINIGTYTWEYPKIIN